jgi:hypothetical protein
MNDIVPGYGLHISRVAVLERQGILFLPPIPKPSMESWPIGTGAGPFIRRKQLGHESDQSSLFAPPYI